MSKAVDVKQVFQGTTNIIFNYETVRKFCFCQKQYKNAYIYPIIKCHTKTETKCNKKIEICDMQIEHQ